jgi:hypothetical protein
LSRAHIAVSVAAKAAQLPVTAFDLSGCVVLLSTDSDLLFSSPEIFTDLSACSDLERA